MKEFFKKEAFLYAWPIIASAVLSGAYLSYMRTKTIPPSARELLSATLNISAIIVGFLGTAKSILFALVDTDRIKVLKMHGSYMNMISYLIFAITCSMLLAIFTACCLLIDMQNEHTYVYAAVWLFMASLSACSFYQVILTLNSLLRSKDN